MNLFKYRYSHLKNIRVRRSDGTVERKYLRGDEVVWKQVDAYTLGHQSEMRKCPKEYTKRLLQTAL